MKKMAKVLTFLMCAALAFTFWGCENPAASTDGENKTPQENPVGTSTPGTQGQGTNGTTQTPAHVPSDLETPLTIEVASDGQIIIKNPWSTLKYKKNGGEAVNVIADEQEPNSHGMQKTIEVSRGDKLEFFAAGSENTTAAYPLTITCRYGTDCSAYGNVMSLLNSSNFSTLTEITQEKAFYKLFCDNHIKSHNQKNILLPATILSKDCYNNMFAYSMEITKAPDLPATTLAEGCYEQMFDYCRQLTRAPELLAVTLAKECYQKMFYQCANIQYIKCLATDIRAENCTTDWVKDVSNTGTFVKANGVNWSRNENGIPASWTIEGEHTITVTGGVASVNGQTVTKAEAGVEVTVTANTPATGKEFDVWLYNPEILNENNEHNSRVTFTMPAENVTLEASYEDIYYSINVDSAIANGSLSVSSRAAYNQTVTISANPSEYYALNSVTVRNGETNVIVNGDNNTRTFTMPAGNVTISATFRITPIGTKKRPTEVGDIVFNDGTALPASIYNTRNLTDREKQNAIAVVANVQGSRCLSVGLKQDSKALCSDNSIGKTNTTVFSHDGDARATRDAICNDNNSVITDYSQDNYSAIYWAQNYAGFNNLNNITNDWLIPSKSELLLVYNNKSVIITATEKIGSSYATVPFVNETTTHYLTVSQSSENAEAVYRVDFTNGDTQNHQYHKTWTGPVLVIRYFYCGD